MVRAALCLLLAVGGLGFPFHADPHVALRAFAPPPEVRIEGITAADGETIVLRLWGEVRAPRAIVLGVHGFTDYGRGFAHLSTQIPALAGFPTLVLGLDQRGFGESASRGHWAGIAPMLSDLDQVIAWTGVHYPQTPLILVGESMGAALVLAALNRDPLRPPEQVRGVVLLAPAIWGWSSMPWYQRMSLEVGRSLWPSLELSGRGARQLGIRPTDDEAVAAYLARDPNMLRKVSLAMLAGLTDLMERAQTSRIPQQVPTLIAVGGRDKVIPVPAVCAWAQRQPPAPAFARERWLVQDLGYHMLTRQKASGEVLDAISRWARAVLEDPPAMAVLETAPQAAQRDSGLAILPRDPALARLCA
jgi:alpha-beta hydrolase superfamily lysophospholipase